jgi:hypothetical protein
MPTGPRLSCGSGYVVFRIFGPERGQLDYTAMRVHASLLALAGSPAMMRGAS